MTIALALDYIRGRMEELGVGTNYHVRLRHFVLLAKQQVTINADTHYFILVNPPVIVSVQSIAGVYDLTVDFVNELQYEHQGRITVNNYSSQLQHITFVQVIPKNN